MRRTRTFLPRRSFSQTHLKSPGAEQEPPRRILRAPTDARESDPISAVVDKPARPTECGPYAANVGEAEPRGGLSACLSVCLSRTAISTAIDASLAAVWLPQLPLILTTVSYRAGFAATRPAILGECHHGEIGRWARTAVLQSPLHSARRGAAQAAVLCPWYHTVPAGDANPMLLRRSIVSSISLDDEEAPVKLAMVNFLAVREYAVHCLVTMPVREPSALLSAAANSGALTRMRRERETETERREGGRERRTDCKSG